MRYLSKSDILSIMDPDEMIGAIEDAYDHQSRQSFLMPDRMHIHYDENTLLLMPCVLDHHYGTKLVTVFPGNRGTQVPVVDGLMVLNDSKTGQVKALMNGQILTAIRTGAVGGTAVKHLANKSMKHLGIIGTGIQGYYQALFACHVHDIETIYLFNTSPKYDLFQETFGSRIVICQDANQVVSCSDIVITTTTSNEPVFTTEAIEGKLFIGIGSFKPHMREYQDDFMSRVDQILVDTPFAKDESGDLKVPLDRGIIKTEDIHLFSQRPPSGKTMFFKSVGMALFDVTVAERLYLKAERDHKGQVLEV